MDYKKVFLRLSVSSLLLSLSLPLMAMTEAAVETKSADKTVEISTRKAVLAISTLGLESKKYSFPVYYKALNAAIGVPVGKWDIRIDQSFADTNLAKQYRMLVSSRFDKLIFEEKKASIITATKTVNSYYDGLEKFSFSTGTHENFKTSVLEYLNGQVAKKVKVVLSEAKEARYSEMTPDLQESFINNKAKEMGIPVTMLKTLVSSSFAFAVYLPKLEGHIMISQVEKYNITMQKYIAYETSFSAPLQTKLSVFTFDGETFSLYKDIDSSAGADLMGSLAKSISGSASISRKLRPRASDAPILFNEVFELSLKDSLLAISTRLKEDRKFAVSATLDAVEGSQAEIALGVQEDIRVDHPFKVYRTFDDKETQVGFIKVSKPGRNCLVLPVTERTVSKADIIKGNGEYGDLAVEHPWTGVYGDLSFSNTSGNYLNSSDEDLSFGGNSVFYLGFNADLGYVLNHASLSEVWMNINVGFGSSAAEIASGFDSGIVTKALVGFEKRVAVGRGLYIGFGADIAYEQAQHSEIVGFSDYTFTTTSIVPRVKAGYNLSENAELALGVGYNTPIATTLESDDTSVSASDFSKSAGLDIRVGFSYHIDFSGPFAKFMQPASNLCESLKK